MNRSPVLKNLYLSAEVIPFDTEAKYVIFSDLHMGNGSRTDDFRKNSELCRKVLEDFYLPAGYTLILNGDIEELQKFRYLSIRSCWEDIFRVFDKFHSRGKLIKIAGNHDALLWENPPEGYPYPVHEAIRLEAEGHLPIFITHGHHASPVFRWCNGLIKYGLRYISNPIGIKNYSVSQRNSRKRRIESRIYSFAKRQKILAIIGHTHRPLFESVTRTDSIKWVIERSLRSIRYSDTEEREKISRQVTNLIGDYKLARGSRAVEPLSSIYSTEIPVPCLFNSGCAIGKRGITGIEIVRDTISLIHWSDHRINETYLTGGYERRTLSSIAPHLHKVVLRKDDLPYIMNSIRVLGEII